LLEILILDSNSAGISGGGWTLFQHSKVVHIRKTGWK
jgi:hypothetical protein